jgi:hypothetical protein
MPIKSGEIEGCGFNLVLPAGEPRQNWLRVGEICPIGILLVLLLVLVLEIFAQRLEDEDENEEEGRWAYGR